MEEPFVEVKDPAEAVGLELLWLLVTVPAAPLEPVEEELVEAELVEPSE